MESVSPILSSILNSEVKPLSIGVRIIVRFKKKIILIIWDLNSSSQVATFKSWLKDQSFIGRVFDSIIRVQSLVVVHFAIRLNFLQKLLVLDVLIGSRSCVSFKFSNWDVVLLIDVWVTVFSAIIGRWFYCIKYNLFLVFRNNWLILKSNFEFFNCLRRHRSNTSFELISCFDE